MADCVSSDGLNCNVKYYQENDRTHDAFHHLKRPLKMRTRFLVRTYILAGAHWRHLRGQRLRVLVVPKSRRVFMLINTLRHMSYTAAGEKFLPTSL
jgi:hypothetical protein